MKWQNGLNGKMEMEKGGVSELKSMSKEMTESEEQRIYCVSIYFKIYWKNMNKGSETCEWRWEERQWCKRHFLIHG